MSEGANKIEKYTVLGAHRIKYVKEKKVKIMLRRDISKDLSCK